MSEYDYFIVPYGCMECSSIIPEPSIDGNCPRCGSNSVRSFEAVLGKLIELELFMAEVGMQGLDDYE